MATITEDYVSSEIAELLKEKGFEEECVYFYDWDEEDEIYRICSNGGSCNSKEYPTYFSMPTLQMAMKWLREKHNLFIQVTIVPHTTITMEQKYYLFSIHKDRRRLRRDDVPINYYNTYEEACEAAIKYCLENLFE